MTLDRALVAALLVRQPSLDPAQLPPALFAETVRGFDEADRTYQAAIEAALPPAGAREMLAASSAFRERVSEVRSSARAESDGLFARYGIAPLDFDPLDVVMPRVAGLSHGDSVRLPDLCDRARQQVAVLRAEANARIAPLISEAVRDQLVAAKRARIAAFHGAVHAELARLGTSIERFSQTVEGLAALADGWY